MFPILSSHNPRQQSLLESLLDPATTPPERFRAGHRLAQSGDPRPGVGVDARGIPDVDWLEVPGGEFVYQAGERYHSLPTYYIARYPVTVAQYRAFVDADGYANQRYWTREGWLWREQQTGQLPMLWDAPKWHIDNHPVVGVTWFEAMAFCAWYSHQHHLPADLIRLPSEWEWEKAARGTDGRMYPWGMHTQTGNANINETYAYYHVGDYFLKRTTAVGAFVHDRSPYGVMDMAGNVREWCLTDYHQIGYVVRGGCWFSNRHQASTVYRNWFYPGVGDHGIGFRMVATIRPTVTFSANN